MEFGVDGPQPRPGFHKQSLDLVERLAQAAAAR